MIRFCLHGAESTGKTTLAARLGAELAAPVVPEYGRVFTETHGTELTLADLLEIGREQDRLMRKAALDRPPLLLLDTDPLMTAAWAEMLSGEVPDELLAYAKAELYLLFEPDVPWVEDGTRFFGSAAERRRFADIARDILLRTHVPFQTIDGDWAERERQARRTIEAAL